MRKYEGLAIEIVLFDLVDLVTTSFNVKSDNIGAIPDAWLDNGEVEK